MNFPKFAIGLTLVFLAVTAMLAPSRAIMINPPSTTTHVLSSATIEPREAPVKLAIAAPETVTHHDALAAWIHSLIAYECTGSCPGNPHFRSLDSNDRYSYGCLQFQQSTWDEYSVRYRHDAVSGGIYDCASEENLAYAMIHDDPALWSAWYTSVMRGAGYPPNL